MCFAFFLSFVLFFVFFFLTGVHRGGVKKSALTLTAAVMLLCLTKSLRGKQHEGRREGREGGGRLFNPRVLQAVGEKQRTVIGR